MTIHKRPMHQIPAVMVNIHHQIVTINQPTKTRINLTKTPIPISTTQLGTLIMIIVLINKMEDFYSTKKIRITKMTHPL